MFITSTNIYICFSYSDILLKWEIAQWFSLGNEATHINLCSISVYLKMETAHCPREMKLATIQCLTRHGRWKEAGIHGFYENQNNTLLAAIEVRIKAMMFHRDNLFVQLQCHLQQSRWLKTYQMRR